jgi:hypothetical protein
MTYVAEIGRKVFPPLFYRIAPRVFPLHAPIYSYCRVKKSMTAKWKKG